ncbi:hypothetical protein XI25_18545 [Paenibacillus sp. DMB20]|nr:hypothetical protein XI25_18545 [Paenibacillus sp. DMB20]
MIVHLFHKLSKIILVYITLFYYRSTVSERGNNPGDNFDANDWQIEINCKLSLLQEKSLTLHSQGKTF